MKLFKDKDFDVKTYSAIIYLLIMSGSILQSVFMGILQKINIFVTFILIIYHIWCNKKVEKKNYNLILTYLWVAGISYSLIFLFAMDFSGLFGYLSDYCLLLLPFCFVLEINLDSFKEKFINIMTVLALISLLMFYFDGIPNSLPALHYRNELSSGGYDYYFLYGKFSNSALDIYHRNIGIFWEPGMYQGYLVFCLVLIAMDLDNNKNISTFFKVLILFLTLISTGSTTGLVLLIPVVILYVIMHSQKKSVGIIGDIVMLATLALIIYLLFIEVDYYSFSTKYDTTIDKLSNWDNTSRNTRFYNILNDLENIIDYPLGVPRSMMEELRNRRRDALLLDTDGSVTNSTLTMCLSQGVISGLLYLFICLSACWKMGLTTYIKILISFILLTIINTEPHFLGLFFTYVFFAFSALPDKTVDKSEKVSFTETNIPIRKNDGMGLPDNNHIIMN